MLNVLHVTPFFPPDKGGIANLVRNLCHRLSNNEVHVSIVAPRRLNTSEAQLSENDILVKRVKSIYLPGWPYPTLKSVSIPLDFGNLIKQVIRDRKIEIVHIHGHHYPISWIAAHIASNQGIPVVLSVHGMYALDPNVLGGKSRIEDLFNRVIFPRLLRKSTLVIGGTYTITEYAKKFARTELNYSTVPNGVDTKIFIENINKKNTFRREFNFHVNSKIILFVGRFERVKGIIEFARACKEIVNKFNNAEVVLVGTGFYKNEVFSMLGNIDRVHLLGWQNPDTIYKLYIVSDFYVLSSRFEALPLTILEAMNAGLHIIYTDVGGVSDILVGYTTKTLIRDVSAQGIKFSLEEAMNSNCSSGERLKSLTYARKFDWKIIADDILDLYRQIL